MVLVRNGSAYRVEFYHCNPREMEHGRASELSFASYSSFKHSASVRNVNVGMSEELDLIWWFL